MALCASRSLTPWLKLKLRSTNRDMCRYQSRPYLQLRKHLKQHSGRMERPKPLSDEHVRPPYWTHHPTSGSRLKDQTAHTNLWFSVEEPQIWSLFHDLSLESQDVARRFLIHLISAYQHRCYPLDIAEVRLACGKYHLERLADNRPFGRYVLEIAAGMGHLDAALLLHRISRYEGARYMPEQPYQLIRRAVDETSHWRAVIALAETEVLEKLQHQRSVETVERVLNLLAKINDSPRLRPLYTQSWPSLGYRADAVMFEDGSLDANALEATASPAYYYWTIFDLERDRLMQHWNSKGAPIRDHLSRYSRYLLQDANWYGDPRAQYHLTRLSHQMYDSAPVSESRRWLDLLEAASACHEVPEAKYSYGKYLLRKSRLYSPGQHSAYEPSWADLNLSGISHNQWKAKSLLRSCAKTFAEQGKVSMAVLLHVALAGIEIANEDHSAGKEFLQQTMSDVEHAVELAPNPDACTEYVNLQKKLIEYWDTYKESGLYEGVRPEDCFEQIDAILSENLST